MNNRHFEWQILCRQYIKERGEDPKQNPVAHHEHLHEADLTLYCLTRSVAPGQPDMTQRIKSLVSKTITPQFF